MKRDGEEEKSGKKLAKRRERIDPIEAVWSVHLFSGDGEQGPFLSFRLCQYRERNRFL